MPSFLGRVIYEMMEAAFRCRAPGERPDWTEPRPDNRRGKEVRRVEHLEPGRLNAELVRGDLGKAVQRFKQNRARDCSWVA